MAVSQVGLADLRSPKTGRMNMFYWFACKSFHFMHPFKQKTHQTALTLSEMFVYVIPLGMGRDSDDYELLCPVAILAQVLKPPLPEGTLLAICVVSFIKSQRAVLTFGSSRPAWLSFTFLPFWALALLGSLLSALLRALDLGCLGAYATPESVGLGDGFTR